MPPPPIAWSMAASPLLVAKCGSTSMVSAPLPDSWKTHSRPGVIGRKAIRR
jgi:hypothetical protein